MKFGHDYPRQVIIASYAGQDNDLETSRVQRAIAPNLAPQYIFTRRFWKIQVEIHLKVQNFLILIIVYKNIRIVLHVFAT